MDFKSFELRNLIYLIFVVALITITGCNDFYERPTNLTQYSDIELLTMDYADLKNVKSNCFFWSTEEANMIAIRFLELDVVEGKYKLNMSHEEAVELHIRDSDFERMIREIAVTNDFIKKWSRNKNMVLELSNHKDYIMNTFQIDSKLK